VWVKKSTTFLTTHQPKNPPQLKKKGGQQPQGLATRNQEPREITKKEMRILTHTFNHRTRHKREKQDGGEKTTKKKDAKVGCKLVKCLAPGLFRIA
jgi:hypothetical protein